MIRVFRLDQDPDGKDDKADKKVPNPWKSVCPTLVGSSTIVCRRLAGDKSVTIKRLHGLESMRLMGWDLGMYKDSTAFIPNCSDGVTPELLCDMAGNAWCQWHFIPLMLATGGSIDWTKAKQDIPNPAALNGTWQIHWPLKNNDDESDDAASSSDDSD